MNKSYYLKKHGYFLEDLRINQEAQLKKKISENDINLFSKISGDDNPIHMDEKFARSSIFKKRIAHGFLSGSLISTVIAKKLPGPGSIYLNQTLKFLAPVYIGDTITVVVTIKKIEIEKGKVSLQTECFNSKQKILTGQAEILVSGKKDFV